MRKGYRFRKGLYILFLTLLWIVFVCDSEVYASTSVWSGKAAKEFIGGTGTEDDPYLIASPEEFERMRSMPKKGYYYKLTSDLVFNQKVEDYKKWGKNPPSKVLKNYDSKKGGPLFFDGDGHTISGVFLRNGSLFGNIVDGGVIQNLTVEQFYAKNTPCIANELGGVEVSNVILTDGVVYSNKSFVAGVAGIFHDGKITNSTVNVSVTAADVAADQSVGGFFGDMYNCQMIHCENNGAISAKSTLHGILESTNHWKRTAMGGLCGRAYHNILIDKCLNTGTVKIVENTDADSKVAGLVGFGWLTPAEYIISNSVNSGTIIAHGASGIQYLSMNDCNLSTNIEHTEGNTPHFINCVNAGTLKGKAFAGMSYNSWGGIYENCYNIGTFEYPKDMDLRFGSQLVTFNSANTLLKDCFILKKNENRFSGKDIYNAINVDSVKRITSTEMKKKIKSILQEAGNV